MRRYLNNGNVPLSVAVWLATDEYDYVPNTLSATSFLKPTRQLILSRRLPEELAMIDVMSLVKSRMGTAIHNGIEQAWLNGKDKALLALGHPERIVNQVVVNPNPDDVTEDQITVYMEHRSHRELAGHKVSGKFDFVAEGRLEDFKSTGVFTWVNNTKDDDYIMQMSIYKWLNPKIITEDDMRINFIFWDWQAFRAKTDKNYPEQPIMTRSYPLLSEQETETFMKNKLREIEHYKDQPEEKLPLCTDKELWRKEPVWKYYKNPKSMGRSTKNFDNKQEAYSRLAKDKGVGTVVEIPGEVVACKYCSAFPICSQKDALIADGSLKL